MKFSTSVTSDRSKCRKAFFTAPKSVARKFMSSHLSAELKNKYNVRSLPIRVGDHVQIKKGSYKGTSTVVSAVRVRTRKVFLKDIGINKKRNPMHQRSQEEGETFLFRPIDPSNLVITRINMTGTRKKLIERKSRTSATSQ